MHLSISIHYAICELVGSGLAFIALLFLLIYMVHRILIKPDKDRQDRLQRVINKYLLVWTLCFIIQVIWRMLAWTDIIHSFPDSCGYGDNEDNGDESDGHSYCASCDRSVKAIFLVVFIKSLAANLFFYEINRGFQSTKFMKGLRNWMVIIFVVQILCILEVFKSSRVGHVLQVSNSNHGNRVCESSTVSVLQSHFISSTLVPLTITSAVVTCLLFNATFLWRALQIWKGSVNQKLGSTQKIESLANATHSLIRHCILASLLICSLIVKIVVFIFVDEYQVYSLHFTSTLKHHHCDIMCVYVIFSQYLSTSIWMNLWTSLCFLMFIPLMESTYQKVFGRAHRYVFRKCMDRYSSEMQRVYREEWFAEMKSKLSSVSEDEEQKQEPPEVKLDAVWSTDSGDRNNNSMSPFSVFEELENCQPIRVCSINQSKSTLSTNQNIDLEMDLMEPQTTGEGLGYGMLSITDWKRYDVPTDILKSTIQITNRMISDQSFKTQSFALIALIESGGLSREFISKSGNMGTSLDIKRVLCARYPTWRIKLVDEWTTGLVIEFFPVVTIAMKSGMHGWEVTLWQNADERLKKMIRNKCSCLHCDCPLSDE